MFTLDIDVPLSCLAYAQIINCVCIAGVCMYVIRVSVYVQQYVYC